MTLLTTQTKS